LTSSNETDGEEEAPARRVILRWSELE